MFNHSLKHDQILSNFKFNYLIVLLYISINSHFDIILVKGFLLDCHVSMQSVCVCAWVCDANVSHMMSTYFSFFLFFLLIFLELELI